MDKLERHIKEKLQQRSITPSPGSWERVVGQLSDSPPKRGRYLWAYALAACFIGALPLVLTTLDREPIPDGEIQLVEGEHETRVGTETFQGQGKTLKDRESTREILPTIPDSQEVVSDSGASGLDSNLPQGASLALDLEGQGEPEGDSDALILRKVEEVVAQLEHLERVQAVSDREVDSLLRAAQQQILRERVFQKDGGVDALALLAEVEEELDASFRERVFEALKTGYLKMRSAVAQRND